MFATCAISTAVTILSLKRDVPFVTILKVASVFALVVVVPVVGLVVGTFYSHGFDVPWWVFGGVNAVSIMLVILITGFVLKLLVRAKNKET